MGHWLSTLFFVLAVGAVGCASNSVLDTTRRHADAGPPYGDDGGSPVSCTPGSCPSGEVCSAGRCVPLPPDGDLDGVPTDFDCDDDDPGVGGTAERPCSGPCGDGLSRCSGGTWDACDAPTECDCTGSVTEELSCEMCGIQTRQCVAGSWQTVGSCRMRGVCSPGTRETGSACGRCGVEQRTCDDGCSWSDWTCVEDERRCNMWALAPGGDRWTGYWLTDESIHAPAEPVRAAVVVEGRAEAWVLAGARYHVLDTGCIPRVREPCWKASGPLADLFGPALTDAGEVLWASEVPAAYRGDGIEGIDVFTADRDIRFERVLTSGEVSHISTTNFAGWSGDAAPDRESVRAAWTDVGNAAGWVDGACGSPPAVPEGYIAYIDEDAVHLYAPGAGCGFYDQHPFRMFAPFALPGAPPLSRVAAAFYDGALFVLAED